MKKRMIVNSPALALIAWILCGALGTAQRTEEFQFSPVGTSGHVHIGWATAIDGDWAAVGDYVASTPGSPSAGACVMYRRTEQGWIKQQTIAPPNSVFLQNFAVSLALHGDELVIGAYRGGIDNAGRVYVYRLVNEIWVQVQELRAFDGGPGFRFGHSVAFDAESLVVGSSNYPDSTFVLGAQGTAYVYRRSGGNWVLSERIPLPDGTATHHIQWSGLGWSCTVEGDVLVLGAPGSAGHGMAFVYRRGISGWVKESDLYLPQFAGNVSLLFGFDVDISGGVIAVGAPVAGTPWVWGPSTVAFFEFQSATQTWGLQQTVRASDWNLAANGVDRFGYSLSLQGKHLAVGAQLGSYDAPHSGTAYLFEQTNGTWAEVERLVPSDPNPSSGSPAFFGSSVAIDSEDGRVLVGSINALADGYPGHPGKAYVYDINQGTVVCPATPNVTLLPTRLTATGTRSVQAANLSLSVYDAPRGLMGLYLVGPGGPPIPFGANANLCVGQPFLQLTGIKTIGQHGSAMHNIDFSAPPASTLINPGAALTFQFIHRDRVPGTGFPTINSSDAVEVTFE